MIVIRYCGGLGNQMYQYALQKVLENKYPNQEIKADIFHYNMRKEHNGFELQNYFDLKLNFASSREVRKVYNGLIPNRLIALMPLCIKDKIVEKYQYIYLAIANKINPKKKVYLISDVENNGFNSQVFNINAGNWYVRGLWQNINYFHQYRDELVKAFKLFKELSEEDQVIMNELNNGNVIAVHIRGGDFLNPKFNLCGRDYYTNALKQWEKNTPLCIFTDDVQYAKDLMKGYDIFAVISHPKTDSITDMYMLSLCKNIVVSNSTFAFWGAYLNECKGKKIVCPKYATYNEGKYINYSAPDDWIIVNNRVNE